MPDKWSELCELIGIKCIDECCYPSFDLTKQWKIVDFFADDDISFSRVGMDGEWMIGLTAEVVRGFGSTREEAMIDLLIKLWPNLLEGEQNCLKMILEEESYARL